MGVGNGVLTRRSAVTGGTAGRLLERLAGSQRLARLDDRELVERAAAADGPAFGELYERYVDDVFHYLSLRVRDRQLAEDLTQDVFVNALRGLSGFRWQGAFRPWLLRVAHNRLANHWRSIDRRPKLADLPDSDAGEPERSPSAELVDEIDLVALVTLRLDSEAAEAAMSELTELQQQALALRFGLELSVAETAAAMGRSQSAVKNLQFSALGKLRRALGREDESR